MQENTPDNNLLSGENDLFAPQMLRFPWRVMTALFVLVTLVAVFACVLLTVILFQPVDNTTDPALAENTAAPATPAQQSPAGPTLPASPTAAVPTNTPTAQPTVTQSPTPTTTPCIQVVEAGDSLISLAYECGHRDQAIIDLIVELNGLAAADTIQLGQTIEIPWPTPTADPADQPAEDSETNTDDTASAPEIDVDAVGDDEIAAVLEQFALEAGDAEPTLPPGVEWYTVQTGDNILSIALQFNANVRILSELNPEVTFSQCDFGMDSGGGSCIVNLFEGQRLRVPAPTPTPTLSPTPSGSETPTPTATATFNAPAPLSPGDRANFGSDEIITLRWVTTGTLNAGETYLITVVDETAEITYTETTTDTLFVLPEPWQPTGGERHTFRWTIAIGPENGANGTSPVTFATEPRIFTWDSR